MNLNAGGTHSMKRNAKMCELSSDYLRKKVRLCLSRIRPAWCHPNTRVCGNCEYSTGVGPTEFCMPLTRTAQQYC